MPKPEASRNELSDSTIGLLSVAAREASTTGVRVRLLITLPVVFVLLITLIAGVFFWLVDAHFGSGANDAIRDRELQEFAIDWLRIFIVATIGGAIVGVAVGYSITEPIRRIIQLNQRIAGGDLRHKLLVSRTDEVGELGSSFNHMLESLNGFIESRNRFILESFSGGLVTVDVNGTVTAINSAAEKMLGVHAEKAAGRPLGLVLERDGLEELHALYKEASWRTAPITSREVTVSAGGNTHRLSVNANPMRDRHGNVFGLILNLRDMREVQRFHEQMQKADRLATMGTFASGLAHEVRNPLGAIKGTAQLLVEDVRESPRASEYLRVIIKEVNRLDDLVREVQAYSQPSATKQLSDLVTLMSDTVALARNNPKTVLKPGVQIIETYEPLPPVNVSPDKVSQALLNIVLNAIQATPENGVISIASQYSKGDPLPVRLWIRNTGSSIPTDHLTRIFEPFFTSKDTGTGLGLSIAYQVVAYHGGELSCQNEPDGVAFSIRLPHENVTPT